MKGRGGGAASPLAGAVLDTPAPAGLPRGAALAQKSAQSLSPSHERRAEREGHPGATDVPFGALPASCSGRRRAVTTSRDRVGEAARAARAALHCPGRTPASSHTVLIQFPANQARGSEPALRAAENRGSTTGWLWRPKQVAQTRGLWPRRPPSPVPSASQSRAKTLLPVGPAGATGARRGLVQDQGQLPPTTVPLGEAPPPCRKGPSLGSHHVPQRG